MEIPTARILEDGVMRIGYAQAIPYRWYSGGMGILPGLEFTGRFTELTNITAFGPNSKYGHDKDKAFDLKYQLLPESKYFPAIAIGINDFHGTKLFPSEYSVVSRQIFPFDFSMGIGSKRFKGPGSSYIFNKYGLFGGIEWAITKHLHAMVEYNPINYKNDKKLVVKQGAKSHINTGLRIKILPGIDLGVSYQRGDTLGLMCHFQLKLGKPIIPKKPDPPYWGPVDRSNLQQDNLKNRLLKIQQDIFESGFQDVLVYANRKQLIAEFENNKYLSNQKAAGRVLRILLYNASPEIKKLVVILKKRGISFLKVSIKPKHLEHYLLGNISESIFSELVKIESITQSAWSEDKDFIKTEPIEKINYQLGIKPDFETYLNDPSGVFKAKIGIKPYLTLTPWKGGSFYGQYDIPFYSNINSSNNPPQDSVRSDSFKYYKSDLSFERLTFSQAFRISKKTYGRMTTGYFDEMFAGAGGEALTFFGDGKLALGFEGDWVRKRKPEAQFNLLDYKYHSILGNAYYKLDKMNITLLIQYGRFLAGDIGWRFEARREFDSGVTIGAWYSLTGTNNMEGFNKGYNDKGFFISIPARIFSNNETNIKYNYSLSPWTRDVAQTIPHWQSLYDLAGGLMPGTFKHNLDKLKK